MHISGLTMTLNKRNFFIRHHISNRFSCCFSSAQNNNLFTLQMCRDVFQLIDKSQDMENGKGNGWTECCLCSEAVNVLLKIDCRIECIRLEHRWQRSLNDDAVDTSVSIKTLNCFSHFLKKNTGRKVSHQYRSADFLCRFTLHTNIAFRTRIASYLNNCKCRSNFPLFKNRNTRFECIKNLFCQFFSVHFFVDFLVHVCKNQFERRTSSRSKLDCRVSASWRILAITLSYTADAAAGSSPDFILIKMTPCVFRESLGIFLMGSLMTIPFLELMTICSLS